MVTEGAWTSDRLVLAGKAPRRIVHLFWAQRVGAGEMGGRDFGSIAVDRVGHSYVTGGFRGSTIFGAGEPNEAILTGFSAPF